MKKTATGVIAGLAAVLITSLSSNVIAQSASATNDCNRPFGNEERICKITHYQVIARKGNSPGMARRNGTNTFDIILYTTDIENGGDTRLAELSYFDRAYSDIPRNGHVLFGSSDFLSDWYQINAHHRQFEGTLRMLQEGKNPRLWVRQIQNNIVGDIRTDPVVVE